MKSLTYIILWLLFQLLVEINCQLTPKRRYEHTATLIDGKLYFLGGEYDVDPLILNDKEFFYLGVSEPFNTKELQWRDLSSIDTVPKHSLAASVKGGANNNTLFLYGGLSDDINMALVYTYNPQSNTWSIPTIAGGTNAIRTGEMTGIIDRNGKMYMFGGWTAAKYVNDMHIIDTINLSYVKGSSVGVPSPRGVYGATLLPDNNIIYIGGVSYIGTQATFFTLKLVYIYDTSNDIWSTKETIGTIPSDRASFSAVLGLDGQRIINFGGTASDSRDPFIPVEDSLYSLNLNNFEWSIPKTSGQVPKSRMWHRANVIEKYMVISFGFGYNQSSESDILLLDISNNDEYVWTSDFVPLQSSTPSPSSSPTEQNSDNKLTIIVSVITSFGGSILLSLGGFYLYKRKRNKDKRDPVIPTPGDFYNPEQDSSTNHQPITVPAPVIKNNNYNYGQQGSSTDHKPIEVLLVNNDKNNHGQEAIPVNDRGFSSQSFDELKNELENAKQEIQDLKQIILQNNGQASNNNR